MRRISRFLKIERKLITTRHLSVFLRPSIPDTTHLPSPRASLMSTSSSIRLRSLNVSSRWRCIFVSLSRATVTSHSMCTYMRVATSPFASAYRYDRIGVYILTRNRTENTDFCIKPKHLLSLQTDRPNICARQKNDVEAAEAEQRWVNGSL